jgi:NAD(P)-dependent dehydrogenase (short-subunit alcohol dehydrogenase family)
VARKVALVTGSSHGIGQAIAIRLARNGYDVGVTYRSRKSGALDTFNAVVEAGARCEVMQVDISDLDQIDAMYDFFLDRFGRLDLLVNNAAVTGQTAPFLETSREFFQKIADTNFRGSFFSTQRAAKEMIKRDCRGVIINISSNQADGCWPDCSVYGSMKAALSKLTKHCAMELAPYGIRVVCIQPGYVDVGWDPSNPVHLAKGKMPLGRFAEPEEIANAVAFLASEQASYITGSILTVDGGALLPCVPENTFE